MASTIAFINQKGGCGKSSTCFHLGGCLAAMDFNVLLVDADPQGSLSQGFFGSAAVECLEKCETLAGLFDEEVIPPNADSLILETSISGVSIICANQFLAFYNTPSPEESGNAQQTLSTFLDQVSPAFDFVLIDCPPNLYQCSWNALLAADFVVVPVPPEDFGTQGLRVVHQAVENARLLNPKLRRLGHLVTRIDARLSIHKAYEAKLRQLYHVFNATVPEAAAFKMSLACRTPVTQYAVNSKAARQMRQVADEIVQRIQEKSIKRRVA